MKCMIGKSQNTQIPLAVQEATSNIHNPSLLILTAPMQHLEEAAALLQKKYPQAQSVGTSGVRFLQGRETNSEFIVMAFFEEIQASAGVMTQISTCPLQSIAGLEQAVRAVSPQRDRTVCLEFCTGAEEKLVTTLNMVLQPQEIGLIGATVFGYPDGQTPIVACNGRVYEDACAYVIIKSNVGKVKVYKQNLYGPMNHHTHRATKVNRAERELITLDNRPAAQVYSEEMHIPKDQILDNVIYHPIGRVVGGDVYISAMGKIGANDSFINYKQMNQNDTVYFLKLLDYQTVMTQTQQQIQRDFSKVSAIFTVDCAHRYLLFQTKKCLPQYLQYLNSFGPHLGVVAGGEQFNNQHVNQTMVCVVFE